MKIVIAPDSFKGSMSSKGIIDIIADSAANTISPDEIVKVPIADGGEGTIDAVVESSDGHIIGKCIKGPTGEMIKSYYGLVGDKAIIEMAICSGLPLVPEDLRNPQNTSSYGTGEMIKHVLDDGFRKIIVGIGGSATNDGGTGAMEALGVRYLDADGQTMEDMCGRKLSQITSIDISSIDPRIFECDISVMCDVRNPLTGPSGATYVYGPQKGADSVALELLESGMIHYEKLLNIVCEREIGSIPGAGAAGGMGAALTGYLNAELVSGIDAILELSDFDKKIAGADFIITGEGRVDSQSASGKVIQGITERANRQNIPVIVVAGGVGDGLDKVYDLGVKAIMTLPDRPMSLDTCMKETKTLLKALADNVFNMIAIGKNL